MSSTEPNSTVVDSFASWFAQNAKMTNPPHGETVVAALADYMKKAAEGILHVDSCEFSITDDLVMQRRLSVLMNVESLQDLTAVYGSEFVERLVGRMLLDQQKAKIAEYVEAHRIQGEQGVHA